MKKETKAMAVMAEIRKTNKFDEMSTASILSMGYTVAMLATVADTNLLVMVKEEIGGGKVSIRFIVDKENIDMSLEYDGMTLNKTVDSIKDNPILRYQIDDIINTVRKNRKTVVIYRDAKRTNPKKFIDAGMVQMCL
jgi:hypothetical protein